MNTKQLTLLRKWERMNKNLMQMQDLIIQLMANPETTPEHLKKAHAAYVHVFMEMREINHHVSNILRTGKTVCHND